MFLGDFSCFRLLSTGGGKLLLPAKCCSFAIGRGPLNALLVTFITTTGNSRQDSRTTICNWEKLAKLEWYFLVP